MAFGMIAKQEVIQRILRSHEEMLVEQLKRVEGKVWEGWSLKLLGTSLTYSSI